MEIEEKKRLTRDWICMMIFAGTKTMDYFVNEGCRVMIYGWKFEELETILNEMVADGTIINTRGTYSLPLKGKFNIKKTTIIPLLDLTDNSEYYEMFLEKNRENCDIQFLDGLYHTNTTSSKEGQIIAYAKENYEKLATIISLVVQFMSGVHT